MMFNKVAFIGAGSMAEAIISGMLTTSFLQSEQIAVMNKNNQERLNRLARCYGVQCSAVKAEVLDGADIIILSMKPSDIKAAVASIKDDVQVEQLVVSVVAGVSTDDIASLFDRAVPVVRAMPNTSASIGYSATAITKGKHATEDHVLESASLFDTIGTTTIVREADMHTVTGISGSGPAYFYYMVEALEKVAVESGLDREVAEELITQTVIGAGEMLKHSGKSAASLRENITSPNGTTQAGVETLAKHDFESIIKECVSNARKRSMELGGERKGPSMT